MAGIKVKLNEQKVKLNFEINEDSLNNVKSRIESFIKDLESKTIKIDFQQINNQIEQIQNKINNKNLNLNVDSNLSKNKEEFNELLNGFSKSDNLVKEVTNAFRELGEVSVTTYKNANKEINSFTVKLQDAEGNIKRIKYMSNKDENGNILGYNLKDIVEVNNQAKVLAGTLKEEQKIRQAISKENEKLASQIGNKRENSEVKNKEELIKLSQKQSQEENKTFEKNIENVEKLKAKLSELKLQYKDVFSQSNGVDLEKQLNKKGLFKDSSEIDKLDSKIKGLKTNLTELKRIYNLGEKIAIIPKDSFEDVDKLNKSLKDLYGESVKIKSISEPKSNGANSYRKLTIEVKDTTGEIQKFSLVVDRATESVYRNSSALGSASSNANDFGAKIKNGFQSLMSYAGVAGVMYEAVSQFKNAVSYVNDSDKSFTNFAMVMNTTKEKAVEVGQEFSNVAKSLYTTNKEIYSGAEELLRAGLNMNDTKKMLEASTVASKLSGQQSAQTSEQLISIMNGFKMETKDMMGVVDTMVGIDNAASTSFAEIAQAMQRTASSAKLAGVNFKDLSTYIGTVSSVTRKSAESIGESFKSLFARYQNVKGGKKFDPDNEPLSNVEKDLNKVGIALRSSKGEFRDFSVVLDDIKKKWKDFSQVQKCDTLQYEKYCLNRFTCLRTGNLKSQMIG